MIYTGVRIDELLSLKKENIHLEEHYFDVIKSKTENGIRKVPISDYIYPFVENWIVLHHRCRKPLRPYLRTGHVQHGN